MAIELASGGTENMLSPRIIVVGVGGGGCNAINNMIESNLQGIEFLAANTDAQSLRASKAQRKLQLGSDTTAGLGSGAQPDVGRRAAQESSQDIRDALEGCNMLFIAAGMGGGTGTGAAPVFAEIAQTMGILTIAVVTKPFEFEGGKRMEAATEGLSELQKYVGTLIVIPNQNLFRIANDKTTFSEAFKMADEVLCSGVRSITDLIIIDGLVNLDFADICTVMNEMGKAMMGTGEAEGEDRAVRSAEAAITNPLLEDGSLRGAKEVMVNITAGRDIGLHEIDEAIGRIRSEAGEDAYVHFGAALDESMHGIMRISVVATGMQGGGQQALALDGHISQQRQNPAQQTMAQQVMGGEEQTPHDEAALSRPMPSADSVDPVDMRLAMDMTADSHVATTVADNEPSASAADNNNNGEADSHATPQETPQETIARQVTENVATENLATELHQALQWPGGPGAPAGPTESAATGPALDSPEASAEDSPEDSSRETPDEAFITPAAHTTGHDGGGEYTVAQAPVGMPTEASEAPQASAFAENETASAEHEDEADDGDEAEVPEKKSLTGLGGSIFALWRNNKSSPPAEKPETEQPAADVGDGAPSQLGEASEAGEESLPKSPEAPEAPVAAAAPAEEPVADAGDDEPSDEASDETSDEDVVVFRERRFLPEDESSTDEAEALDEEEDDSNLLRIPAFLRR